MPTIILNEIECIDPRGSRDDMMLTLTTDEIGYQRIWGPERMRAGDRINLHTRLDPIIYDDFARISLYEHDRVGRNDYFGTMNFFNSVDEGSRDFYFPGDANARYRINYHIRPEPMTMPEHIIEPISLTCDDAQGSRDEVTLCLNSFVILGPMHKMKTNWQVNFEEVRYSFRTSCEVSLRETYLQNWSRSFSIAAGNYVTGSDPQEYVFDAHGPGAAGDARYTFSYRMLS